MGEAALVEQDVEDGARLVLEIDSNWLPVAVAIWAHESSLDVWRLIIAIRAQQVPSPKAMYGGIQEIIINLDLGLALNRISVVTDKDPIIHNLRQLIQAGTKGVVEIPVNGLELAGDPVDRGYGYHIEALRYQADVFKALQRSQPQGAVLRRVGWLDFPQRRDLDFVLDNGEVIVFVETKALSHPLGRKDIDRSAELRRWTLNTFRRFSVWLLISQTGFSRDVLNPRGLFETPANDL